MDLTIRKLHTKFEVNRTVSFGEEDFRNVLAKWPLAKTIKYATLERNSGIHTICILFPLVLAIHLDHTLRNAGPVLEILSSTGENTPQKAI